jgi:hypothetical protein
MRNARVYATRCDEVVGFNRGVSSCPERGCRWLVSLIQPEIDLDASSYMSREGSGTETMVFGRTGCSQTHPQAEFEQ